MSPVPHENISVSQITFFDGLQACEVVLVNALCYGTFYCLNAQFPNANKAYMYCTADIFWYYG